MSSSYPAAVTSSRTSTTSAALLRNGPIWRFLVRNISKVIFLLSSVYLWFCLNHVYQRVSLRWYPVLQIYVWHEQHRVGLQVHRYRRPQRTLPDRYCTLEQTHTLLHLCKPASLPLVDDSALTSNWILRLSLSLFICLSLIRFWDTEANVSRWPSAQSLASGWHLGVAGGRGLSPDRKPAAQSHSLVAAAAAVSVPDVRVQSLLIHFCLFPSSSLQCFSHLM